MERKDFLKALKGHDPTLWLEALNSGHIIETDRELKAVLRIAHVARADIQEAALNVIGTEPGSLALPVQRHLALAAVDPNLRSQAIQAICKQPGESATEPLLLAAFDEHPTPKEAALRCLGHRRGTDIQAILIGHVTAPESFLEEDLRGSAESIRVAALSSLKNHIDDHVIGPLIRVALKHSEHRGVLFEMLEGIGKVKVSTVLIETIVDGPPDGMPSADNDFENRTLGVIAAKPPRKGKSLEKYRALLRRLYKERLRPNQSLGEALEGQLAESYDDSIGQTIVEKAKHFAANPDQ